MKTNTLLRDILSNVTSESCPGSINFHCHTLCSDGSLTPTQLIKQAAKYKVNHIAVTDHHTVKAYPEMYKWLELNKNVYRQIPSLWTGIEIRALLRKTLVHIIGLGFELEHESLVPYIQGEATTGINLQATNVVKSIHKAGGLAILAHPARYRLPFNQLIIEAYNLGFDGAEAWYDYNYSRRWQPTNLICESIHQMLKQYNLLSSCGTDTHGLDINKS